MLDLMKLVLSFHNSMKHYNHFSYIEGQLLT